MLLYGIVGLVTVVGYMMKIIYKLMKHKPEEMQHQFIIKGGRREKGGDTVESKI